MSRADPYSGSEIHAATRASPYAIVDAFQRDLARVAFALTGDATPVAELPE